MIAKTLSLLTLFVLLASANGQQQSSPPATKTGTKPSKPTSVVLADTDDTCHLFLDDTDEGTITPAQSRKLSATPGEHIIKCSVEGIPDLLWRKVVEVKVGSQSAVVISLKALHIQYDTAIDQRKKQQEQALEVEEKDKVQAKAAEEEQKAQAAANAAAARQAEEELPRKVLELIKGGWVAENRCSPGAGLSYHNTFRFHIRSLGGHDNRQILGEFILRGQTVAQGLGDIPPFVMNQNITLDPSAPNSAVGRFEKWSGTFRLTLVGSGQLRFGRDDDSGGESADLSKVIGCDADSILMSRE